MQQDKKVDLRNSLLKTVSPRKNEQNTIYMHVHIRIYIYIFVWPQRELEYMRIYMLELVQQIVSHSCLPRYAACRLWACHVTGRWEGFVCKTAPIPTTSHSVETVNPLHPLPAISVDSIMWKKCFILYIYSRKRDRGVLNSGIYCML